MSEIHNGSPKADRDTKGVIGDASGETLRRDGNAAAGLLSEIFAIEMTSAQTTCEHCGRVGALGALLLYGGEMGAVLRCPTCDAVQVRVARIHGQYWMDLRGMATMRLTPGTPA